MTSHILSAPMISFLVFAAGCQLIDRLDPPDSSRPYLTFTPSSQCEPPPPPSLPSPCDPDWQRGQFPRTEEGFDPTLDTDEATLVTAFETLLHDGVGGGSGTGSGASIGTMWVGNEMTHRPDSRAIVQVDVYSGGSPQNVPAAEADVQAGPKLIEHGLWYVADIPMNADLLMAIDADMYKAPPIGAKVLGYCFRDGSFRASANECSGDPQYAVVKYDPRCVCNGIDLHPDVFINASR